MEAIFIFVLSFLGINFLVFLPNWIIGMFSKIERSKKSFFYGSPYFVLKKIFYERYSDDVFRLILEIQMLTLLMLVFNSTYAPYFKPFLILFVMLSFIYIVYISAIIKVFKKEPMLLNDLNFVKTGLIVYKKKVPLILLGLLAVLVCVFLLSNSLVDMLTESYLQIDQKWPLIIFLFISIMISIYSIIKIPYELYHGCVSFSLIKHLSLNLKKGRTLKKSLKTLNNTFPYDYVNKIELKKQPNVIFVFLESYGSFALSDNEHGAGLKKKIAKINNSLLENKWKTVSTLSESPVSSGGSWLSHSSILFGTKVKDIAAHETIFNHTDYVSKLDSLPKYFNSKGYKTAMTSTFSYDKGEVNWEKVNNAYPFDDMMLYDDFDYTGQKVTVFGDRLSLPDEYTLNYAYHSLLGKSPFFLSVNTINSHYSFISPIESKKNWKDYNTEDFEVTDGSKKNYLKNYFLAINYQLDYIHNFLLNTNLDDTIIVLIGDHQPPIITPADSDKATPIHVISKNNTVINTFKEFNFTDGLVPTHQTQKHESFFSKFLYTLNKAYGKNKNLELPIFEDGINLY